MGQESSSPPCVFDFLARIPVARPDSTFAEYALSADVRAEAVPGNFRGQGGGGCRVTGSGNSHEARVVAHEMRQASRPKPELGVWRLASPSRALTSAILARLTGTRCGDGPSSSITAPSPSLRTKVTCGIATIWLRCTRTNSPGSSCASASEIDHGHIRSRVPSWTRV